MDAVHCTVGLGGTFPGLLCRRCGLLRQTAFSRASASARCAVGIALVTLAALGTILLSAWLAWRQWGFGTHAPPHDDPTAHDRSLFQGFATLLLSGLSFVAVIYDALPALFMTECLR